MYMNGIYPELECIYMGNIRQTETDAEGRGLRDGVYFSYTHLEGYIPLIPIEFNTFLCRAE